MTTTRLSDVVVPELWTPNFILESPELVRFFNSGIVERDPVIDTLASGEGQIFNVRHMNDLANDEENISSDNPSATSTPKKVTGAAQVAIKLMRNQSWSSMDLVAALQNPDPVNVIRDRIAAYWARRWQAATVAIINGVIADNEANDSGDMVFDATGLTSTGINGEYILEAKQTAGDAAGDLSVIAMHSQLYTNLQKQNLIVYLRDGDANVQFPTYLGYRVVVDDGLPTEITSNGVEYVSALYAPGALRLGMGSPKVPTEIERKPDSGNGEGEEILYNRQHFVLHPRGFSYQTGEGTNPANSVLESAAAWDRVFERKQVGMAFLRTLEA